MLRLRDCARLPPVLTGPQLGKFPKVGRIRRVYDVSNFSFDNVLKRVCQNRNIQSNSMEVLTRAQSNSPWCVE